MKKVANYSARETLLLVLQSVWVHCYRQHYLQGSPSRPSGHGPVEQVRQPHPTAGSLLCPRLRVTVPPLQQGNGYDIYYVLLQCGEAS